MRWRRSSRRSAGKSRQVARLLEGFDLQLRIRVLPDAVELPLDPRGVGVLALFGQRRLQTKERSRVARVTPEIFPERSLCLSRLAGQKERRSQRLAQRVIPGRRLVVRQ